MFFVELNYKTAVLYTTLRKKALKRSFAFVEEHIGSLYNANTISPFVAQAVQKSTCASNSLCWLVGYCTLHLGHSRKLSSRKLECFREGLLSYVVSFSSNTVCKSSCGSIHTDSWSFWKRRSFSVRLGHACAEQTL